MSSEWFKSVNSVEHDTVLDTARGGRDHRGHLSSLRS